MGFSFVDSSLTRFFTTSSFGLRAVLRLADTCSAPSAHSSRRSALVHADAAPSNASRFVGHCLLCLAASFALVSASADSLTQSRDTSRAAFSVTNAAASASTLACPFISKTIAGVLVDCWLPAALPASLEPGSGELPLRGCGAWAFFRSSLLDISHWMNSPKLMTPSPSRSSCIKHRSALSFVKFSLRNSPCKV